MKTIKDIINNLGQSSAAPSHVYDRSTKKIWTAEDHGHLRAVRRDFAEGKMMVPRSRRPQEPTNHKRAKASASK
jgi:hypothetical protein